MPVMGGWEFLDNFSEDQYAEFFQERKVIVLSSTIDPEDIDKAKTYPMVLDFMSKPITIEMLERLEDNFNRIKKALDSRAFLFMRIEDNYNFATCLG